MQFVLVLLKVRRALVLRLRRRRAWRVGLGKKVGQLLHRDWQRCRDRVTTAAHAASAINASGKRLSLHSRNAFKL